MSQSGADPRRVVGRHVDAPAENLLFTVYRCWMAGEETRDVTCPEIAWSAILRELPGRQGRGLIGEFHAFLRVLADARRAGGTGCPGWRAASCRCLCRDECLVLAMLEAAQLGDFGSLIEAAWEVAGDGDLGPLVETAQSLADALVARGLFLSPMSVLPPPRHGSALPPPRDGGEPPGRCH